jgi:hypothetical protein
MSTQAPSPPNNRRRYLLGVEPFFEGGWLHKEKRAQRWDVESDLVAFALFGDVTVDLAHARSTPAEITIQAWALFRDVDITVPPDIRVELSGGGIRGDLNNHVPDSPPEQARTIVRVKGHTLLADVTIRPAPDLTARNISRPQQ